MNSFPFPDMLSCEDVLSRDPLYSKIPEQDRQLILERAWKRGTSAASEYFSEKKKDVYAALQSEKLSIARYAHDEIIINTRYFAEIIPKSGKINIYKNAVSEWARENSLEYEFAEEIILAHEIFHWLEYNKLVQQGREIYSVPILKLGSWVLLHSGINAVSEISAYAFSYAYYKITKGD